jgi:hypothetical protein
MNGCDIILLAYGVAGSCKDGNELLGSIRIVKFIECLVDCRCSRTLQCTNRFLISFVIFWV